MRVLHCAAEIFPFVKTGGLADVVAALPKALIAAGADVRYVLPGYPAILTGLYDASVLCEVGAAFGAARVSIRLGTLHGTGLKAYVVDAPYLYQRDGNPYVDAHGQEWSDNLQRFALLGWVAAHLAAGELDPQWVAQVLHTHDWHAAMACAYVAAHPASTVACVHSIHNMAYQGLFAARDFHLLGLPGRMMVPNGLEFHGHLSFMKAGASFSHRLSTVSPTYAREIATEEFGHGLDGLVRARGTAVKGILNGVDGNVWNPAKDPLLAANYSAKDLSGKALCKQALQRDNGLAVNSKAPVFAVVSRLTQQKGLDLLLGALPGLLKGKQANDAQFVIQGEGDPALHAAFAEFAAAHPQRLAFRPGYDESMAHRIIAGSDLMLVPSRFEPCGLTQLYALRYGTVPLVRRVGGLADTVVDSGAQATGFSFNYATPAALTQCIERAIATYGNAKQWSTLQATGMAQDFSWSASAREYLDLYRDAIKSRTNH